MRMYSTKDILNPKERLIDAIILRDDSYKRHLKRNNLSNI